MGIRKRRGDEIQVIYINTYCYETDRQKYKTNIEDLFRNTVMNDEVDSRDADLMWIIDQARYQGNNTITNFMDCVTSTVNLSRGLKTLLVIRWFIKNNRQDLYFDITSCGNNVMEQLIDEVKGTDVYFLTRNYAILCNKYADILVNNTYRIKALSDLASLGGKLYAPNHSF